METTARNAIAKADRKAERSGRAYMVTSRSAHPAYPGETVFLVFPKDAKAAWAEDERPVFETDAK